MRLKILRSFVPYIQLHLIDIHNDPVFKANVNTLDRV